MEKPDEHEAPPDRRRVGDGPRSNRLQCGDDNLDDREQERVEDGGRRPCRHAGQGAQQGPERGDRPARLGRRPVGRRDLEGQVEGRHRGDRHALWRERLGQRSGSRSEVGVRQARDQGRRRHRRELQAGQAGLRPRDGADQEARHHRLHPHRPGRHRLGVQAAARSGAKLVFMDNVPKGMVAGKDYVSVVSADNYGNGVTSAHLMAKALGGKGEIGLIHHEADFFVTKQRYDGFKSTIEKDYPDIKIVDDKGIAGPDFAGDAQNAANAMLTEHPNLAGIWAVWDVPAEGVMAAARASGRTDLKIATEDLGTNAAIALAKNQLVIGLGAQRPFDQGVAEARLGAGSLLGKKEPAYVALSALPVEHANVLEAWKQVYHADPPKDLSESFAK